MGVQKFALCIDNADYQVSLETLKLYKVLPDEYAAKNGLLRVIDESGDDYLFPETCFVTADLSDLDNSHGQSSMTITFNRRQLMIFDS